MHGSIGCPTMIVTPVPHMRELARGEMRELSKQAKFRLSIFDWYYRKSVCFSVTGKPNVPLTCRHFGIHRSYFYRWKQRYDKRRLSSLENRTTSPHKRREPEYSRELVRVVRAIRKENPTYSAKKLRPILLRSMVSVPSSATLGRLIRRERLFFRADVNRHTRHSNTAKAAHTRLRKPAALKADGAGQVIEFDMKHINLLGNKLYAFCAIDTFSRESVIHVASSPSSLNAKRGLEKAVARFGRNVVMVNDNGSENGGKAEAYLAEQGVVQFWARPHRPKDKPFVERFIGTLQRECLDYHYEPVNVRELTAVVDGWLDKYHFYRPHEALGMMTPAEFSATLGVSIPHRRLSYLY